jgi:hypothetical protein
MQKYAFAQSTLTNYTYATSGGLPYEYTCSGFAARMSTWDYCTFGSGVSSGSAALLPEEPDGGLLCARYAEIQ